MEIMWSVGSIPMHFRQIILRIQTLDHDDNESSGTGRAIRI